MQWLNEFPCLPLECRLDDDAKGVLELVGPRAAERVGSGVQAAFGAGFASIALGAARWIPGPLRLLPLGMAALGGLVAGSGVVGMSGQVLLRAERGRGVTLRWGSGPLPEREQHLAVDDIAAWEVVRRLRQHTQSEYSTWSEVFYALALVTRDGRSRWVERFDTETQARLRQAQLERTLATAAPVAAPAGPRARASRSRRPRRS
jgi:hypothetical protein